MVAEREKIRFISSEPKLGRIFRASKPLILPAELHDYVADWVEDVGAVMRSREMMVGQAASVIYYAVMLLVFNMIPFMSERRWLRTFLRV